MSDHLYSVPKDAQSCKEAVKAHATEGRAEGGEPICADSILVERARHLLGDLRQVIVLL